MKLKKYSIIIGVSLMTVLASCNKWLDVPAKDRLTQNVIFSNKDGFLKALNGIYSELNSNSLYGRDLTMGMLDAMAQYYNTSAGEHVYQPYATFNYASDEFQGKSNTIWTKMYQLIANANAILDETDSKKDVLLGNYYGMVKGETLGLRAMLHFDLLRMFGPIYSEEKDKPCIPYIKSSDRSIQPLLSSQEISQLIIQDLEDARALLLTADPIFTKGAQNFPGEDNNDMNYRQYKFNYFAATALLARVYQWMGDSAKAMQYAKEVIENGQASGNEIFPFVTPEEVNPTSDKYVSDRVFSKEVIFAGYNLNRYQSYNAMFNSTLSRTSILTFAGNLSEGRIKRMYDNENDYRRGMWAASVIDSADLINFRKFEDLYDNAGNSDAFRYMQPLIRISEMYLIIAEGSDDLKIAGDAVNTVRVHRGTHDLTFNTLGEVRAAAEMEFQREFQGEGQLFFYFKRKAYTDLPDGNRIAGGYITMALSNYTFPLPESETKYRTNN